MSSIQKSIFIKASPDEIYDILIDVVHWRTWTRSVISAELIGDEILTIGSKVRLFQPRKRPVVWEIIDIREGQGFTWQNKTFGLTMTSSYVINAINEGSDVHFNVNYEGWLSPILYALTWAVAENFMEVEIHGLKRHLEINKSVL